MSKQDIEKRLGFAAQGVKAEMAIGSYKQGDRTVTVNGKKYEVLPYQMDFFIKELATLDTPEWRADVVKEYLRRGYIKATASRPGAKAKMGFLSRVGYAATALTADPADPKSPEYRKQVSEAKAAAKDAITNYKFMRDKVKERLAALDAYVTNAIKVINSATSAKDIEHYVEQLRIAVKSQSMILGASKSPFSRAGAKAEFAMKVDMPELRAEFLGFDVDSNGNKIARFKKYSGETVRIQTNGNLPKSHRMTNQSLDAKAIEQEVLSSSYASKFALKPRSSRPGTKAKMSATFIVAEAIFNAENAVRRGDNENARRWIKAAQDAMDETVVSTGMRSKLEQLVKRYKMSRPGVKAKA